MVCAVQVYEKPLLTDPVLIEGLPGIGFVANISASYLIKELGAKLFADIRSSFFQDFAITIEKGKTSFPINELYYYKGAEDERDLIIFYGNTQALTTVGQYELCGRVLDIAQELGCSYIITLGGLKREKKIESPHLYCAAADKESLQDALGIGAKILGGQIFGVAGLLIGLGKLRGMKGFCLLAETLGSHPDATAARETLNVICKMLHLRLDLSRVDQAAEVIKKTLTSFAPLTPQTKGRSVESGFHWLI